MRKRLGAVVLAALLCGCSNPQKAAQIRHSWDAACRMTAEAWLSGSVSTRFAVDTLETAAEETQSSKYEPLRTAISQQDHAEVRKILR
jgi:hypothetical protein